MEKRFEVKDELVLGQYEVMAIVRNYLVARGLIDPKDAQAYRGEFVRSLVADGPTVDLVFTKETKTLDFVKV